MEATHEQFWKVCRDTKAYWDGTDTYDHEKPDCSCAEGRGLGCLFLS